MNKTRSILTALILFVIAGSAFAVDIGNEFNNLDLSTKNPVNTQANNNINPSASSNSNVGATTATSGISNSESKVGNTSAVGGSVLSSGNSENTNNNSLKGSVDSRNTNGNANSINGRNTNTGTNTGTNKSANKNSTGAQSVTVDAGRSDSYESKYTAWAPVVHGAAAPALASANLVVVPGVCGPRVKIVKTDIVGKRFGVWGGTSDVVQGQNDTIESADEPFIAKGNYQLGHIVTTLSAVVGASSGGSFSIGGFGKSGDGGQGGGAATGALQQIATTVTVRDCIFATGTVVTAPVVATNPYTVKLADEATIARAERAKKALAVK